MDFSTIHHDTPGHLADLCATLRPAEGAFPAGLGDTPGQGMPPSVDHPGSTLLRHGLLLPCCRLEADPVASAPPNFPTSVG